MTTPSPLIHPRDLARGVALLTRLPAIGADGDRGAESAWSWPLVGGAVGGIAGLGAALALIVGLPPAVAAGLALAAGIFASGALHEDGLADCADGIWGGHDFPRRLEIMTDSRIGSYGVVALILCIGLHWILLTELVWADQLWAATLVPAILSRAAMVWVMVALPFARRDGLARHVGQPHTATAAIASVLAIILALLLAKASAIVMVFAVAVAAAAVALIARRKLGGQTGDVLGATQQVTALAALAALLIVSD